MGMVGGSNKEDHARGSVAEALHRSTPRGRETIESARAAGGRGGPGEERRAIRFAADLVLRSFPLLRAAQCVTGRA